MKTVPPFYSLGNTCRKTKGQVFLCCRHLTLAICNLIFKNYSFLLALGFCWKHRVCCIAKPEAGVNLPRSGAQNRRRRWKCQSLTPIGTALSYEHLWTLSTLSRSAQLPWRTGRCKWMSYFKSKNQERRGKSLGYGMHEKSMFSRWPFTSKGETGMDFCNPTGSFVAFKPYRYLGGY